jgi:hypothetical protein
MVMEVQQTVVLAMTNSLGRVLFEAVRDTDGTYSYRSENGGGAGLSADDVVVSARFVKADLPSAAPSGELAAGFDAPHCGSCKRDLTNGLCPLGHDVPSAAAFDSYCDRADAVLVEAVRRAVPGVYRLARRSPAFRGSGSRTGISVYLFADGDWKTNILPVLPEAVAGAIAIVVLDNVNCESPNVLCGAFIADAKERVADRV